MAGFTVGPWLVPWNLHKASIPESRSPNRTPKALSNKFSDSLISLCTEFECCNISV
jgi:hypothetical protein